MKTFLKALLTVVLLLLCVPAIAVGQTPSPATDEAYDGLTASTLFDDANTYLDRKFAQFNRQKIPYDEKLEKKTKQEQKELAAKYAAVLSARASLSQMDRFYLGMLAHLAGNGDLALDAMGHYLDGQAKGQNAQLARAVVVLYATRKGLLAPSERAVTDYANDEPRSLAEWFGMESLITELLQKTKAYENMATHAQQMAKIARLVVPNRGINTFRRDDML